MHIAVELMSGLQSSPGDEQIMGWKVLATIGNNTIK
jgi:hypothetical protein